MASRCFLLCLEKESYKRLVTSSRLIYLGISSPSNSMESSNYLDLEIERTRPSQCYDDGRLAAALRNVWTFVL